MIARQCAGRGDAARSARRSGVSCQRRRFADGSQPAGEARRRPCRRREQQASGAGYAADDRQAPLQIGGSCSKRSPVDRVDLEPRPFPRPGRDDTAHATKRVVAARADRCRRRRARSTTTVPSARRSPRAPAQAERDRRGACAQAVAADGGARRAPRRGVTRDDPRTRTPACAGASASATCASTATARREAALEVDERRRVGKREHRVRRTRPIDRARRGRRHAERDRTRSRRVTRRSRSPVNVNEPPVVGEEQQTSAVLVERGEPGTGRARRTRARRARRAAAARRPQRLVVLGTARAGRRTRPRTPSTNDVAPGAGQAQRQRQLELQRRRRDQRGRRGAGPRARIVGGVAAT